MKIPAHQGAATHGKKDILHSGYKIHILPLHLHSLYWVTNSISLEFNNMANYYPLTEWFTVLKCVSRQ